MTAESQERIPYIGPLPFLRQHRDLFFGRDNEVSELLSLVISHRVLLLYAQSGAGKTSLLNAGLVPALEEEGFEVLPVARVTGLISEGIEPGEIPNLYVFNTLMSWSEQEEAYPKNFLDKSLADFLKQRERLNDDEGQARPRVVIFDQFEELFSAYQERWTERKAFFEKVADMLEDAPLLRVIFAIREDYLAQLDPYAHLLPERLRTRYRLERLRAEAACQAVEWPLRDTERRFAEGVASRLVNKLLHIRVEDAAGEIVETPGQYVEPVQLQIVCQSLWRNLPREVKVIVDDHLERFGHVQEVLRSFYERAIETAKRQTRVSESDIRHWFNDKLITPAGTRGTVFRAKEQTEGIANAVVDALEAQHIIRAERRAGARWYELTHDRLIEPIRKSNEEFERAEEQRRAKAQARARIVKCLRCLAALIAICVVLSAIFWENISNLFKTYSLSITAVGSGSVTKAPNTAGYSHGETVVLTAVPDPNYRFDGWSGALSDGNNPNNTTLKLVMNADKIVTANFAIKIYGLTTTAEDREGKVMMDPNKDEYKHGETVTLKAVPNTGYRFTNWSGDLSDSTDPNNTTLKLVMNADKTVTANFALTTYSLTVTTEDSEGKVTKYPPKKIYNHDEEVTLEAVPNEGYIFENWSGAVSDSKDPNTTLVMDADKKVIANFALKTYALGIFQAAGGSVTKAPDKGRYNHGEAVILEAVPDPNYRFDGWSGALSDSNNPNNTTLKLVMNADKIVTANFAIKTYSLSITAVGGGSVIKDPDKDSYNHGEKVTLEAVPDLNYRFVKWSGDFSEINSPATLVMNLDKSVTANFVALEVKEGDYVITSSLCLTAKDNRSVEAKDQYSGDSNQQWSLKHVGRGHYRIMAKDNEKICLAIVEGGTDIQLNEWQNTENQKWTLEPADEVVPGEKCYKILAGHSDKCLDIDKSSEHAIQKTYSGSDSQRWQLKPVEQSWIGNITVTMKNKVPKDIDKGWKKFPVNLNEGILLSPAIWLWVRGPNKDNIWVTSSTDPDPQGPGEGWEIIPVNLNEGRKSKYIYLWVRGPARNNIKVLENIGTKRKGPDGRGWMQIGPDLNKGAWGKWLYLWVR